MGAFHHLAFRNMIFRTPSKLMIPMRWFAARMLFVCHAGDNDDSPLWEESVRLIRVESGKEEEAWSEAEVVGRAAEINYANDGGECVAWRFVRVLGVDELLEDTIHHGIEVWSRLYEGSKPPE